MRRLKVNCNLSRPLIHGFLLCVALMVAISGFSVFCGIEPAFAAGKTKLNKTKLTVYSGEAAKLRVVNAHQKVKWTTGNKKIVTIKKKTGKYKQSVVLKAGKKAGSCWVRAKIGKKTLKCRVTVRKRSGYKPPTNPFQDPWARNVETLPLSSSSVDLTEAAGYQYQPATKKSSSKAFNLAYTNFSLRMLQAAMRAEDKADKSGSSANDGNILVSPDSVMTALTMTANGANGDTLTEMQQILCGPLKKSTSTSLKINSLNKYLWRLHSRLSQSKYHIYSSANSIWANRGAIKPAPAFLKTNRKYHNASVYETDFMGQGPEDMNRWVYNNTRNMIKRIIDPDNGLSEDSRLVLINATAFEGYWAEPFRDGQVLKNQNFRTADGKKKQKVTMLRGTENTYIKVKDSAGHQGTGFCKYYNGGDVAFVGLLPPKRMDARDFASGLTGQNLISAWNHRDTDATVDIKLPCFSYDYSTSLKKPLKSMGMVRSFSDDLADFSRMMDPDPKYADLLQCLKISDVLHKTHIELDQNGTKAAAVTAVIVDKCTAVLNPPKPKKVYLNRPFVYALVDTQTGIPLFLGVVETVKNGK